MFILGLIYLGCMVVVAEEIRTGTFRSPSTRYTIGILALAPFVVVGVLAVYFWLFFFDIEDDIDE